MGASGEEAMKTLILAGFIILGAAVAVYLVTSLRHVSKDLIDPRDLPRTAFEVTRWASDANAVAYIFDDPAESTPVLVHKGLGKTETMGMRDPQEYLDQGESRIQAYRIQNKKTGSPFGYIVAPTRLEIEAGYHLLKQSVVVSIRDPEDSHHRRLREGAN